MIIRTAVLDDAETLAKHNLLLAKESESISLEYRSAYSGVHAVISDPHKGFFLIAEEQKRIIGQLMITFEWSDWHNQMMWWIQSVYVKKTWRHKGVFTKLLLEIIKRATQENIRSLRLYTHTSNTTAITVYTQTGMIQQPYRIYQLSLDESTQRKK